MKLVAYVLLAAVSVSAVSANAWNGRRGGPVVAAPGYHPYHHHRPPVFRPPPPMYRPPYRPPIYQPPIGPVYPPPVLPPPVMPPPVLPPPIIDPGPVYPVPNPIPDPIEQGIYALPPQIYIRQPCDPLQYQVPVVNTIPAQAVYCSSAYMNTCSQMFNGYQVYPYDVRAPGVCEVRPTFNRTFVLIVNRSQVLAERTSEHAIAVVYRNSVRMGYCR